MPNYTQPHFTRRQTALAVGVALCTLTSAVQAAYTVRDPAIGVADKVENFDGVNPVTIPVLDNDGATVDVNSLVIFTNPTKGSARVAGESIIYTPNAGYTGIDTFSYQISETDWRGAAQSQATSLLGINAQAPTATTYADPGVPAGTSPIHNAASEPGVWNSSPLENGVIGKYFAPNSTSTALMGCNAEDADKPIIDLDVMWRARRGTNDALGNMFTITSAATPTPLGTDNIVLKISSFAPDSVEVNGSGVSTISGQINSAANDWVFEATGKWLGLTPAEFETLPIHILASTVRGKTWTSDSTTFTATVDYSQCSLASTTVTVQISDGVIATEPGSPTDLDEDKDGIPDTVEGTADIDGDGIANYLDLDSDNDSIVDIVEAGGVDSNNDGQVDNPTDANNDGLDDNVQLNSPTDTDEDGTPNFLEVDSNGDGTMDIAETSEAAADTDNNGMRDSFSDTNGDGLDDVLLGRLVTLNDENENGTPDMAEVAKKSSGGGGGSLNPALSFVLAVFSLAALRRRRKM